LCFGEFSFTLFLRTISVIQVLYQKTIAYSAGQKTLCFSRKSVFILMADFADPEIEIQMILVMFL